MDSTILHESLEKIRFSVIIRSEIFDQVVIMIRAIYSEINLKII